MNITKNWKIPQLRPTLSKVFWRKAEEKKITLRELTLKPDQKVSFEKVEYLVDAFVEDDIPLYLEQLYKYCEDIKTLQQDNSTSDCLQQLCQDANEIVQELQDKVIEMEELRTYLFDDGQDDFDLRVQPAKRKINNAILHCLDASPSNSYTQIATSPRSYKARDLLSFLSNEESDYNITTEDTATFSANNTASEDFPEVFLKDLQQLPVERDETMQASLDSLNKDLIDLHKTMNQIHNIVKDQGTVVDSIADNVESAEEDVGKGRKVLKKSSILKAAAFPIAGAVIGGAVGGPIGFVAGLKLGSITGGLAMAGVTGSVIGYQGGKFLKKRAKSEVAEENEEQKK